MVCDGKLKRVWSCRLSQWRAAGPNSRQLPCLAELETPATCEALWLSAEVDRRDLLALMAELPTDREPRLAIDDALTVGQTLR